jgi:zinc transport system ATP-binding protein
MSLNSFERIIEVSNFYYSLNKNLILDNVSLTIKRGDYTAIVGPNGGGKTTLIRSILGLTNEANSKTKGSIRLFNQNLKDFKKWSKIGFVPQKAIEIDRNFPATVYEVIKMANSTNFLDFWGNSNKQKEKIETVLRQLNILELKDRRIGNLSGGQKQRVMIARALVSEPELLILDEPYAGVDIESQKNFYKILSKLNLEKKITILFITHDIGMIQNSINSIIAVNKKVIQDSEPEAVYNCTTMQEVYGVQSHLAEHRH